MKKKELKVELKVLDRRNRDLTISLAQEKYRADEQVKIIHGLEAEVEGLECKIKSGENNLKSWCDLSIRYGNEVKTLVKYINEIHNKRVILIHKLQQGYSANDGESVHYEYLSDSATKSISDTYKNALRRLHSRLQGKYGKEVFLEVQ